MTKVAVLGIILLAAFVGGGIGLFKTVSAPKQHAEDFKKSPDRGTLKWLARKAKSEKKQNIVISGPIVEHLGEGDDPNYALSNYSFVIAQPIQSNIYQPREREIITWYKFRILETISERPPLPNIPNIDPPQDMFPLNEDELLLAKYGGSVIVDDINIVMDDFNFPQFDKDKRYLLIISKNSSRVATLWAGPTGAYEITPDDLIKPVNDHPHPMKDVFKNRFHNSSGQLRQQLSIRKIQK